MERNLWRFLLLLRLFLLHVIKNDERRRYDITAVNYQSFSTKVKLNDNFKKKENMEVHIIT